MSSREQVEELCLVVRTEVRTGWTLKKEKWLLLIFLVKLGACLLAENEEQRKKEEDT